MKKIRPMLFLMALCVSRLNSCGCSPLERESSESLSEDSSTSLSESIDDSSSGGSSVSEPSSELPIDENELIFAERDGGYSLCRYFGTASEVKLPSTYLGKPVIAIEKHAFKDCATIEKITLPDSLLEISESAFTQCSSLKTVNFGSGLKMIGVRAFEYCTSLETIVLPDSLKTIHNGAFFRCQSLRDVQIPDEIEYFGNGIFTSWNLNYTSFQGGRYLGSSTNPYLILCLVIDSEVEGGLNLHENTRYIAPAAGEGRTITGINFGNHVHTIGWNAFNNCYGINTPITLPSSMRVLEGYAFGYCHQMTQINLNQGLREIKEGVFCGTGLTSITLPESLKEIGPYVFDGCGLTYNEFDQGRYLGSESNPYFALMGTTNNEFTQINLHDKTRLLTPYALQTCHNFNSITIPKDVISIPAAAFANAHGITNVTVAEDNQVYYSHLGKIIIEKDSQRLIYGLSGAQIPEGVKIIGHSAFSILQFSGEITFPSSLTTIEDQAFRFSRLTTLVLPNNVTKIGAYAFANCSNLIAVTLSENLKVIPNSAFNLCYQLATLTLPDGVTMIQEHAFKECEALATVEFSASLIAIGRGAFRQCPALSHPAFPESLRVIGAEVYEDCPHLGKVHIPPNVRYIETAAFATSGITQMSVALDNQFYDARDNAHALIETSSHTLIAGCEATVIPQTVLAIGEKAFFKCTMASIIIPENVSIIAQRGFYNCENLHIFAKASAKPAAWDEAWYENVAGVYWYSETENLDGEHWHYVDEVPTVWA